MNVAQQPQNTPQLQQTVAPITTSQEEYQLLSDIAEVEERILEQMREELKVLAPRLRKMNMYNHLEYMRMETAKGLSQFDVATQELRFRLKKRGLNPTSSTKDKLLGWLGFNA